jgi:hypothetical protein
MHRYGVGGWDTAAGHSGHIVRAVNVLAGADAVAYIATCLSDTARLWAEVDNDRTSAWTAASWKTRHNGALQRKAGGVKTALVKRHLSSAERGVWITPQSGMLSRPV